MTDTAEFTVHPGPLTLHTLHLIAGDWSDDGHGEVEERFYLCSLDRDQFVAAVRQAAEARGLELEPPNTHYADPGLKYCEDYEDSTFADADAVADLDLDLEANDGHMDTDRWFDLHIKLAREVHPDMIINQVHGSRIHIGGYGLFNP